MAAFRAVVIEWKYKNGYIRHHCVAARRVATFLLHWYKSGTVAITVHETYNFNEAFSSARAKLALAFTPIITAVRTIIPSCSFFFFFLSLLSGKNKICALKKVRKGKGGEKSGKEIWSVFIKGRTKQNERISLRNLNTVCKYRNTCIEVVAKQKRGDADNGKSGDSLGSSSQEISIICRNLCYVAKKYVDARSRLNEMEGRVYVIVL